MAKDERLIDAYSLKKSAKLEGTKIEGYDFDKGADYESIIKSFASAGFQASHFSRAVEIVKKMIEHKAKIFLGYTSNMVSSGLRDVIRYLVKHKKVHVCVTTAGGIEEDLMKCMGNFILGNFNAKGAELYDKGINRIGNIFVGNELYVKLEEFIQPILLELYDEQKKTGKVVNPSDLIWKFGEKINDEKSVYYWAWRNKIPVYCPAITDGAIGGNIYYFKSKHPDFIVDIAEDCKRLNDESAGLEKSGVIVLGAGLVKHAILEANIFRNGADYAVYINTSQEFDGSDSGALPEEAISWGKLKAEVNSVKVFADATIVFPLMVAETFAERKLLKAP
jgi:deoxyhypusine synthase